MGWEFPRFPQDGKLPKLGKFPNLGNSPGIPQELPYGKFPGGKSLKPYGREGTRISHLASLHQALEGGKSIGKA